MMKSGIGGKKTSDKFISTSRKRIKKNMLTRKTSTRNLSGMWNPKLRIDGKIYTCSKCGYIY